MKPADETPPRPATAGEQLRALAMGSVVAVALGAVVLRGAVEINLRRELKAMRERSR